jgi:hypothetical protein
VRRALLIGFAVIAAACGSSGSHSSSPSPSVATTPSTAAAPTTTSTTVPHDTADTVRNFCQYAHDMTVALNSQPTQFNSPAYNKQVDTTALQAMKHAETIAPVALRADFTTAVAYYQRQYDNLAAVGFDGNKIDQSKQQPTTAERAAVTAIGQFVVGTCHVNGNTTS